MQIIVQIRKLEAIPFPVQLHIYFGFDAITAHEKYGGKASHYQKRLFKPVREYLIKQTINGEIETKTEKCKVLAIKHNVH